MLIQPLFRSVAARTLSACLLSAAVVGCSPGEGAEEGGGEAAEGTMAEAAGAGAVNQLTEEEKAAGWKLLFDGRSLSGWRGLGRDSIPTAHWRIDDGTIHKLPSGKVPVAADGQPLAGGDLMTEQAFGDFELSFEWKVTPAANSGVKYNVSEQLSLGGNPNARAALGFEYQVLDDDGHPDAKAGVNGNRTASGLYDLIAPSKKITRPVGEWNQGRIVFQGNHGEHWLNGEKVVEYDLGTPRMDSLLAASKYAKIQGFAERRTGHIVLQDHNDEAFFRNIKIREIQ